MRKLVPTWRLAVWASLVFFVAGIISWSTRVADQTTDLLLFLSAIALLGGGSAVFVVGALMGQASKTLRLVGGTSILLIFGGVLVVAPILSPDPSRIAPHTPMTGAGVWLIIVAVLLVVGGACLTAIMPGRGSDDLEYVRLRGRLHSHHHQGGGSAHRHGPWHSFHADHPEHRRGHLTSSGPVRVERRFVLRPSRAWWQFWRR